MFWNPFKRCHDTIDVEVSVAKDSKIIEVHPNEPSDVWSRDVHLYPLESTSRVAQPEGHSQACKCPPRSCERCFKDDFLVNTYLTVTAIPITKVYRL